MNAAPQRLEPVTSALSAAGHVRHCSSDGLRGFGGRRMGCPVYVQTSTGFLTGRSATAPAPATQPWRRSGTAWHNTTDLGDDAMTRIATLRQDLAGDIVVPASFQLIPTLLAHDLVDQLRLIVYPVVLGAGERLFDRFGAPLSLRRLDTRILGDGLALLDYEVVRSA